MPVDRCFAAVPADPRAVVRLRPGPGPAASRVLALGADLRAALCS
jgi:hypothetical protein